jgi:phosphonate transport system substrate-binding protein
MNKKSWLTLLAVLVVITVFSAYITIEPIRAHFGEPAASVVRIGVLPDMTEAELQQRYSPLMKYLSEETGLDFRLVVPSDYAELVHYFGKGEVDLALFGGLTFVQANTLYQAEPLVMRDVDTRFISAFVVRNNDPATELTDFKGKVLAFGSSLSTSGHLMPRYFLQHMKQIVPEVFFGKVVHSGTHDKTAYMVRDGVADIGAVNAEIIDGMLRDGRLKHGDLRVVWETPPYPDYVWAVPEHLNGDIKTLLRDAYLQLDLNDEYHRQILTVLGARSYLPAGTRMFQPLQQIATNLELLGQ